MSNLQGFTQSESVGELLGELATHSAALVRSELELAGTELYKKTAEYGAGVSIAGIGAVLALLGGGSLCAAGIIALSFVIGLAPAALIVGALLLLSGSLTFLAGWKRLKSVRPRLNETLKTLEELPNGRNFN